MKRCFTNLFEVLSNPLKPTHYINGEEFKENEIHGEEGHEVGVKLEDGTVTVAVSTAEQLNQASQILVEKYPGIKYRIVQPQTIDETMF